jgi:hypothetical protein
MSESRLSRKRLDLEDGYKFTVDESDFDSEDPSRTTTQTQIVSTPQGGRKFFHHRNKRIEIKPLTEEQMKSDQRYHLRKMFKLAVILDDGSAKHYQCLMCLPKYKLIWTGKTTYQHLKKHVQAVHKTELKRYRELDGKQIRTYIICEQNYTVCTAKKKIQFSSYLRKSEWSSCKVIYKEGLPYI